MKDKYVARATARALRQYIDSGQAEQDNLSSIERLEIEIELLEAEQ